MISLRSNQARQGTSRIVVCSQMIDDALEVISRQPAEFVSSTLVDVHPSNAREHLPVPPLILGFILRDALSHHSGRVSESARSAGRNGVVALMMYLRKPIEGARSEANRCALTTSCMSTR